jgi:hypothetical protein
MVVPSWSLPAKAKRRKMTSPAKVLNHSWLKHKLSSRFRLLGLPTQLILHLNLLRFASV